MKLIVLNLPKDFSEQSIAKLFKTHGNIRDCKLVMDAITKTSKGFAFVEMALEHEGKAVIQALHKHKIGKNRIRVKAIN